MLTPGPGAVRAVRAAFTEQVQWAAEAGGCQLK
jgi:hypothetical protein